MDNIPNYYAIIPACVRYSKIKPNAKLLYGEITCLSNKSGECWANNRYFADLYDCSEKQVSIWIQELINNKFVESRIEEKEGNKRYISIVPTHQKVATPTHQKVATPTHQKVAYNNTSINTTSSSSLALTGEQEEEQDLIKKNDDLLSIVSIEEFKEFINTGLLKEKYPWRNLEASMIDCFLHYEESNRKIKKTSAMSVLNRWITGGDPKRREEERKAWENSIARKSNQSTDTEYYNNAYKVRLDKQQRAHSVSPAGIKL